MVDYFETEDVTILWDVSIRQVQYLCKNGRVDGVVKFGNVWAIPKSAKKPTRTGKFKPGVNQK